MFVGRERELELLNKLYNKNRFNFVVMYGRRRVGKTTLLTEFCRDKKGVFFVSEEYNEKMALEQFSKIIFESIDNAENKSVFNNWRDAFEYLASKAKEQKIILVLDEFQYLVNMNKSIPSLLQNLIDHKLKSTNLFIVVCGSVISFMEDNVLSSKSPLFGRKTAEFFIKPLNFFDSIKFFPEYSDEDKVAAYSLAGGIPLYLSCLDQGMTIEENIKENFLSEISNLYLEPKNLLRMELRTPQVYNSIIEAIALGYTKLNEVATKTGEPKDKVYNYISTLIGMHIVEKINPVTEKRNSRKTRYHLKDNLFRFWYRFVFPNISSIEQGMSDVVYEKKIQPFLNEYYGKVFEDICSQYLIKLNTEGKLPVIFNKIGKWWGTNSKTKTEEEIDIMAVGDDSAIFGECKYRNEKSRMKEIGKLVQRSRMFNYEKKHFYFFSKSGYRSGVLENFQEKKEVFLVTIEDIFN